MNAVTEQTWPARRMRFLVRRGLSDEQRQVLTGVTQATFLPMENIGEQGELDCSIIRDIDDVRNGYTRFFDGDVVVAKITPCFENGKGALIRGTLNGIGFGTTELHVLSPGSEIDARYLHYITASDRFRRLGEAAMFGAAGQKRVPEDFVRDYCVPVPPLAQQRAIADYLDRETARLDTLLAEKERLLKLLTEKRQALITRAVTRGLDSDAPMRDSGILWLGDVPAHWNLAPLRFLVSFFGGATPDTGKEKYWFGDIPWVSPKDMKHGEIEDSEDHVTELAVFDTSLRMIPPSSILVVVRGMILAHSFPVAVTKAAVTVNQDMKALLCRERLDPWFLRDFFRGIEYHLITLTDSSAHGTRKLETERLGQILIPLPPRVEQQQITRYTRIIHKGSQEGVWRARDL